jgi:CRP-like cAMP-binding protein
MTGTISSQEVFGFLTPDQVNVISDSAQRLNLEAGQMVYDRGDPADDFFIVLGGEVTLRLPGQGGVSVVIDQLGRGAVFGGALTFNRPTYALTAQCTKESQLLRVSANVMKALMEKDAIMGYHLQAYISNAYFNRYIDTMKKLQAIIMNLPIEAGAESDTATTVRARSHHA